jgi:Zn-dependent membrane protease YugP
MTQDELGGARKVLNAAAMTYVAAAVTSVAWLLYYVMMVMGGRRD